jgi:hypothetical protein
LLRYTQIEIASCTIRMVRISAAAWNGGCTSATSGRGEGADAGEAALGEAESDHGRNDTGEEIGIDGGRTS